MDLSNWTTEGVISMQRKGSATKTRRHKKKNMKSKLLSKREEFTAEKIVDPNVAKVEGAADPRRPRVKP